MIKKLIISSLVVISVIEVVAKQQLRLTWKEDAYKNRSWVEKGVVAKGWKKIDGQWYNFGNNGKNENRMDDG